jgi:glycine betaine/choline ABC-type transport system substrate-binding protein
VRVGSKNFTESFVIAEIYAQALEAAGMHVERLFNLGSTQIAIAAMQRGNIDLYPEYTGTALIDVLHLPPISNSRAAFDVVARAFKQRYGIVWLTPSPMNDSQALATTRTVAARYGLTTLSDCARAASRLRLATIQEFLARPDGLPGLRHYYGGFAFREIRTYDIVRCSKALPTWRARLAPTVQSRPTGSSCCATTATFGRRTTSRPWCGRRRCPSDRKLLRCSTPFPRASPIALRK